MSGFIIREPLIFAILFVGIIFAGALLITITHAHKE